MRQFGMATAEKRPIQKTARVLLHFWAMACRSGPILQQSDHAEFRAEGLRKVDTDRLSSVAPWLVALAITLGAACLHFVFLTHAGALWRDEVNLVNLSALPGLSGLKQDSFPVVMPLVVRAWSVLGLGTTDLGLRCLGVLVGLGFLAAMWTTAWSARRSPPLLALSFIALNSTALAYGDSLRAYGLGSLLIVLTMGSTWRFLAEPGRRRMMWMTAMMIASVQTLFHNAVLVGAICLAGLALGVVRRAYREALCVCGGGLIAAASLLPYVSTFTSALNPVAGWRTGFRPLFAWLDLRQAVAFPSEIYLLVWALFVLGSLLIGVRAGGSLLNSHLQTRKRQDLAPLPFSGTSEAVTRPPDGASTELEVQLFAAVTLVAALVGFGAFLKCAALDTQPWYFLPLMALVAISFDMAFVPVHRYLKIALAVFAAATGLMAFPLGQTEASARFTNVDSITGLLSREAAPEDFVVVSPWFCGISFARYYSGPAPWSTLPPLDDHRFHRFDAVSAKLGNPSAIELVLDRVSSTLHSGHRVWLVGWVEIPPKGQAPPPNLPPPPLKGWGWSQTPYIINWNDQIEAFLSNHSREFALTALPALGDVKPNENLKVAQANGWKDWAEKTR